MFTGIVEELGAVVTIETLGDSARLVVSGPLVTSDAGRGDSIAVNGCCLTVTDQGDGSFTADVMLETLSRTNLGELVPGQPVNLERAARVGDRLGGHIVQGHIDGTATLLSS
ncbi:MAG: riboflavin synthase, partial [Frankiaceae bacterium]|nr:riboflavin synthase [Frankiaceae bacterium]